MDSFACTEGDDMTVTIGGRTTEGDGIGQSFTSMNRTVKLRLAGDLYEPTGRLLRGELNPGARREKGPRATVGRLADPARGCAG